MDINVFTVKPFLLYQTFEIFHNKMFLEKEIPKVFFCFFFCRTSQSNFKIMENLKSKNSSNNFEEEKDKERLVLTENKPKC